jgi:predicted transcriptional regulator
MDIDAPPPQTLDDMQASLDRALADVAAGRVVPAREVHARLRQAITATTPEQHGTHGPR